MHEREPHADLHNLGLGELRPQRCLLLGGRGTRFVEIRISEDQGPLVTLRESAVGPLIGDLLDELLGEPFLPRDREAQLLSKTAIGDGGVAQSRNLLDGLLDEAVAPEVPVEVAVGRAGEVLRYGVDRIAVGIPKAG